MVMIMLVTVVIFSVTFVLLQELLVIVLNVFDRTVKTFSSRDSFLALLELFRAVQGACGWYGSDFVFNLDILLGVWRSYDISFLGQLHLV